MHKLKIEEQKAGAVHTNQAYSDDENGLKTSIQEWKHQMNDLIY